MRNRVRRSKRARSPGIFQNTNEIGRVAIVNQLGDSTVTAVAVADKDVTEALRLVLRELRAQSELMAAAFNLRDPVKAFRDAEERAIN